MKRKLHYLIVNNGDGSAGIRFFSSAERRQEYQDAELKAGYPVFCESEGQLNIVVRGDEIGIDFEIDPHHGD